MVMGASLAMMKLHAQTIPVEVLVGHERTRLDMLWVKPFKPELLLAAVQKMAA